MKTGKERYSDRVEHVMGLYLNDNGALCINGQKSTGRCKQTVTQQFNKLIDSILKDDGIMRYEDAFRYADRAIEELSDQYTNLFSSRFRYVYVDEYQDCSRAQRIALDKLFNPSKCVVTHIGDQIKQSTTHIKI